MRRSCLVLVSLSPLSANALNQYETITTNLFPARSGNEADEAPFRFSTKYFDPETGLYYFGYLRIFSR